MSLFRTWGALFSLCIFCTGQLCSAQTIKVRTAEHSGFTRIVLDTGDAKNFALRQSEESLRIYKPGARLTFDLKGAFRRLSEGRIAGLRPISGQLEIDLNCACRARPLQRTEDMLIVDIEPLVKPVKASSHLNFGFTTARRRTASPSVRSLAFANLKPLTSQPTLTFRPSGNPTQTRQKPSAQNGMDFKKLTSTRQLATLEAEPVPGAETENEEQVGQRLPAQFAQVNVVFPKNLQTDPRVAEKFTPRKDLQCDRFSTFDPVNWRGRKEALAHLGQHYSLVTDEKASFSPKQAFDLVQTYLALAMGAEARSVLNNLSFPEDYNQKATMAHLISELLDDGGQSAIARSTNLPSAFPDCPQLKAWRLLAHDLPVDNPAVSTLRSEFARWPGPVQGALAATLAQLLSDASHPDAALFILSEAATDPEHKTGGMKLIRSRIELKHGDQERAKASLANLAKEENHAAPESLATLAETFPEYVSQKTGEVQNRLELFAREKTGTLQGVQLVRAQITLALANRDYAKAITVLNAHQGELRSTLVNLLMDKIGEAILKEPSDVAFLNAKLGFPAHLLSRLNPKQLSEMERRTNEIGFPELAGTHANTASGEMAGPDHAIQASGTAQDDTRTGEQTQLAVELESTNQTHSPNARQIPSNDPPQVAPGGLAQARNSELDTSSNAKQQVDQPEPNHTNDAKARDDASEFALAAPVARAIEASKGVLKDVEALISEIEEMQF